MTLHADLTVLVRERSLTSIVGHALIDLGLVTELRCAYDDCCYGHAPFEPTRGSNTHKMQVAVDHVDDFGDDRPENLRLVHHGCNVAKSRRTRNWVQSGDDHWSRRMPHLVKRGDDHYKRAASRS